MSDISRAALEGAQDDSIFFARADISLSQPNNNSPLPRQHADIIAGPVAIRLPDWFAEPRCRLYSLPAVEDNLVKFKNEQC